MAKKRKTSTTPKKRSAPDWTERFLAALRQSANISYSAMMSGTNRTAVYHRRDNDKAFADAMKDALEDSVEKLELEARRRAHDGLNRLKFHQGQPIMVPVFGPDRQPLLTENGEPVLVPYVEHEYSDTLMIFLLKAHRPEKYRDNYKVELSGVGGGPVEILEVCRTASGARSLIEEIDDDDEETEEA
jgi:hypothetical protein